MLQCQDAGVELGGKLVLQCQDFEFFFFTLLLQVIIVDLQFLIISGKSQGKLPVFEYILKTGSSTTTFWHLYFRKEHNICDSISLI